MLYLFTRLNALGEVLVVLGLIVGVVVVISIIAACIMSSDGDEYPKVFHKLWFAFCVLLLLNVAVPTQKDVALILAGSTIMSIARTDEAQRITSKSVRVVEQYLDALLTKEKK